ncbi:Uncharacterised protein [uncultured archaeon]|nr:Uncharacterised protein [uncultured archaeon]
MRKFLKKSLKAGRTAAHSLHMAAHAVKVGYLTGKEAKALLSSMRRQNEKLMALLNAKMAKLPFASKKEVAQLRTKVAKLEKKGKKR